MRRATEVVRTDVLVVGGGLAGLSAAVAAAHSGVRVVVACADRLYDAHSWSSGAMNGVIGDRVDWHLHAEATVRGSGHLADQDAVEILCRGFGPALAGLIQLGAECDVELLGCGPKAFKTPSVTAIDALRVLRRDLVSSGATFIEQVELQGLLVNGDGRVTGARFRAAGRALDVVVPSTVLTTGGFAGLYPVSTNKGRSRGLAVVAAYLVGAELEDLEMVQFHPTALPDGTLVTEAARAVGGVLRNAAGQRFVLAWDPTSGERSTRDVVARAISTEVAAGRGFAGGVVGLDLRALTPKVRALPPIERLHDVCMHLYGIDTRCDLVPVRPCPHYTMGGIATDVDGRTTVAGLYAAGEAACVSVHGANRLGGNSLAECLVFGGRAGAQAAAEVSIWHADDGVLPLVAGAPAPAVLRRDEGDVAPILESGLDLVRDATTLREALERLQRPGGAARLLAALAVESALRRKETRGAHCRADHPEPEPAPWHTIVRRGPDGHPVLGRRPVRVTAWPLPDAAPRIEEVQHVAAR